MGKTTKYALVRIRNINRCRSFVNFTPGQAVSVKSDELIQNIESAKELNLILAKKRLALSSKVKTLKDFIDGHPEKVNAINKKNRICYQALQNTYQL